jgi:hypothetical protein
MTQESAIPRQDQVSGTVAKGERANSSGRGRLGVYVALGAWASAVPLPWVPDVLVRSIRGALVHDIAIRHGVSLAPSAREVLASVSPPGASRSLVVQAVRFYGMRLALQALTRFGPVGLVWPARAAVGTFALGHLFDRYLESGRTDRAIRIDVNEATRVRKAVEGAALRAFGARPSPVNQPATIDEQRDPATIIVDGVLSLAAGLPGRVLDHLDAAFDELLARGDD